MRFRTYLKLFAIWIVFTANLHASDVIDGWSVLTHSEDNLNFEFRAYSDINEFKKDLDFHLACRFPARYEFVKSVDQNIQDFDLSKCVSLQNFLKNIPGNNVHLMITSEYLNAPSSSFGHMMLGISESKTMKLDDPVIHFSAITQNDNALTYSFKGIFGQYPGYFIAEPFFKKLHEYQSTEQRYVFYETIKLNAHQVKLLKYHLFELSSAEFPYFFFKRNCAYRLDELLSIALNQKVIDSHFYTLPQDVYHRYASQALSENKMIPDVEVARHYIDQFDRQDTVKFYRLLKGIDKLQDSDKDEIKTAYRYYYQYAFKKRGIALPHFKDNLQFVKTSPEIKSDHVDSPVNKQRSVLIQMGERFENKTKTILTLRPLLTDRYQFLSNSLHESEVKLLETKLSYHDHLTLEHLTIASLALYADSSDLIPATSFHLSTNLNRENIDEELESDTKIKFGKTFNHVSLLLSTGLKIRSGDYSCYLGPSLNYNYYLTKNLKLGIEFNYITKDDFYNYELFTNYQLKTNFEILSTFGRHRGADHYGELSVRYFY